MILPEGVPMKTVLSLTLVRLLGATVAFAQQNGTIGIFADAAGTDCKLPGSPGLLYVYFVHANAVGATGSQWAAPPPACLTGTRIADTPKFAVTIGCTACGITIGYGQCMSGTFHIMTAVYQVISAPTCCRWFVGSDPNVSSGKIEIPDCDFNMTYGSGGEGILNANSTCCCDCGHSEDTTWGQMKATYGD
jgi:hypothetical protein